MLRRGNEENSIRKTNMIRRFTSPYCYSFNFHQFAILLLSILIAPARTFAQNNSYGVPNMQLKVTIEPDGSALIDYSITYHNLPGSGAKEVVDIGTPNKNYDLRNVKAWIGDRPIPPSDIMRSTVLDTGFEVHFGDRAIPPGRTGVLRVQFTMPKMVFQDTTRKDYASFEITPTWFNSKYIQGNTHLQIAVQLPKWVKPEEALSQKTPFSAPSENRQGNGRLLGLSRHEHDRGASGRGFVSQRRHAGH